MFLVKNKQINIIIILKKLKRIVNKLEKTNRNKKHI